jgi:iron complex outermembrane receptor protein
LKPDKATKHSNYFWEEAMNRKYYLAVTTVLASGAMFTSPAMAQAEAQPSEAANAVDDIVVTARRRPERLQDVPVSVTAVSAETLQSRGLNDLAQISLAAPSLQISADNNFAIRGVGTGAFSSSLESSVAFAENEVNLINPGLVSDFFDVAQVEVLNGPQGLLFGRNASAGLLNVTTVRPELGALKASFDLEGDHRRINGRDSNGVISKVAINVPLGAQAALRVSGFYNYQDPLVDFKGPLIGRNDLGLRRYAVRASLLVEPTDRLSIYVIGSYGEEHGVLGFFERTYRELGAGSVNAAPLAAIGIVPSPNNTDIGGEAGYYRDLTRRGVQGTLAYKFDNGMEISNIAAWKSFDRVQQIDQDGTGINGANINFNTTSFEQFSNELRLALPSGNALSGQMGLYYLHSSLDSGGQIAGNNYFPGFLLPSFPFCVGAVAVPGAFPPTCSTSNNFFLGNDRTVHQTNDSYAAFGQLTYKVTPQLEVLAGGRVTHDRLRIDLQQNRDRYFVTLGIPFAGSQTFSNTNFSWRVGAQYRFNSDAMVYATYGRGYKGPGFNDNAVTPTASLVVLPETNKNIEIGAKTSWLDRKLLVNVSLFHSVFDNYQVQSFDLTTASFIIQNAARVVTKGLEFTVIARPFAGLTVNASATLLDAKFGDYAGAQCYPTQGCTTFNAAGLRPSLSPTFTSSIQGIYEFNSNGEFRPYIEANLYHRSSVTYGFAPGAAFPSVDIIGASIGVKHDNWRASLFCKNCTDQRVPVSIGVDSADAFSGVTSYAQKFGLNSFRTVGLMLNFNF